jgi:predicted small integral membrane protein
LNKWEILETAEISPVLSESQFSMNKMPESAVSRFRDRVQAIWFCFPKSRFREASLMITRMSKTLLLAGVALFYTFVVFNNLTDFDSNYDFVRHVLSMDTTLPGNNGLWRALQSPAWHLAFYIGIIAWEIATTVLLWWGFVVLLRTVCLGAREFNMAKRIPVMALTLSLLMWLIAFLAVGGEWFLMWQSHEWNGQEAAFRNFAVVGLVLLIVVQPETEHQP